MAYVINGGRRLSGLGGLGGRGLGSTFSHTPDAAALAAIANAKAAGDFANAVAKNDPSAVAKASAALATAAAKLTAVRDALPASIQSQLPSFLQNSDGSFVPPPVPGQQLPGGGIAPSISSGPSKVVVVGVLAAVAGAVLFLRKRRK